MKVASQIISSQGKAPLVFWIYTTAALLALGCSIGAGLVWTMAEIVASFVAAH